MPKICQALDNERAIFFCNCATSNHYFWQNQPCRIDFDYGALLQPKKRAHATLFGGEAWALHTCSALSLRVQPQCCSLRRSDASCTSPGNPFPIALAICCITSGRHESDPFSCDIAREIPVTISCQPARGGPIGKGPGLWSVGDTSNNVLSTSRIASSLPVSDQ